MAVAESLRSAYSALDARVSSAAFSFLSRACHFTPLPAPSLRHLPLLASPTPPILLVLAYLAVSVGGSVAIRTLRLKPREREPTALFLFVLGHNLLLLCLSAYLTVSIPLEAWRLGYHIWGNAYNPKHTHMAWLIYLFYVSKFIEFGDTVIMVVRCSVRQVSFLHVYHHSTISLIWWIIAFHAPGGDGYFSAFLNSGVHVAMYGYYFLAALIGRNPTLRHKYLFWGRYLTQMQMTQFVAMMAQATYMLATHVPYPTCLAQVLLVYMCSLLALFGHFYLTKYRTAAGIKSEEVNGSHRGRNASKRKLA